MGRPKKSEPTKPVRVPETLAHRIGRLAAHRRQDVGDFMAEHLTPIVDELEQKMLKEIEKEQKKPKGRT